MPKFISIIGKELFGLVYGIICWAKLANYLMSGKCTVKALLCRWCVCLHVLSYAIGFVVLALVFDVIGRTNLFSQILSVVFIYLGVILCTIYPVVFVVALYKSVMREVKEQQILFYTIFVTVFSVLNIVMSIAYWFGIQLFFSTL
jgi:hypothetical protein